MANVGTAAIGKTLIGAGNGASPTYANIGTNSGLTAHGVLIAEGNSAFSVTAAGTAGQVLQSGGASSDPVYSTATYPGTAGTSGNVLTSNGTNWISSAASGGGGLLTATGTLTSSQIKNLHGTPIVAIAAQGAGKIILPVFTLLKMNYGGSNVFVASLNQVINLYYSTSNNIGIVMINAPIVASSTQATSLPFTVGFTGDNSLFDNVNVVFYNTALTEISGNAANDNTITWSITYQVISV